MDNLRLESVSIKDLVPDPQNARKHDENNIKAIVGSLKLFGQRKPIVITQNDVIVAGNGTVEAAKRLNLEKIVAVRTPSDWSGETIKAYALADNRTAELAEWDTSELANQLLELDSTGWDVAEFGFTPIEPLIEIDEDPLTFEVKETRAKLGDIWTIGNHKIACGDSSDPKLNEKLFSSNVMPDLIFCDPPYGIDYKAMRGLKKIENDKNENSASQVILDSLSLVSQNQPIFICCDWRSLEMMKDIFYKLNREPKACIIWDKESRVQNLDRFAKQHEFILYSGPFGGEKTYSTDIWKVKRDFQPDHPTPKPLQLMIYALQSSSQVGELVYDCFAGSGSTLVAAEKSGRKSIGVELDPEYVDIILERLEKETNLKAELLEC